MNDTKVKNLITQEGRRQRRAVNLIASENYVSRDVLRALGSVLTNKYAEGYPGKRYYGGNKVIDRVEELCKKRALSLFGLSPKTWHANVQPYSGSPANMAVYTALVPLKGRIMGMSLSHGGHLTHGQKVSATGKFWKQIPYGVSKKDERLDYRELKRLAKKEKPHVIVAGFTAYPRRINWKKFREIADACGAYLMVDMSHFAGLVAGGVYPSPFRYADVVTTTTHKTLRGPRGAIIFSRKSEIRNPKSETNSKSKILNSKTTISQAIDRAVFPGLQGGPHENQIAAAAAALREAKSPKFKSYAKQVVANSKTLALELKKRGWRIVSGGTDTHLLLVDTWMDGTHSTKLRAGGISGKEASKRLERKGIIVNMNTIPFDTRKPLDPSGIRLGTPAETTRGRKEADMARIAARIDKILRQ